MSVRRTLGLALIASTFPFASIAFAQDAQPDAGAPLATVSASATTTTPPPPPPTQTIVVAAPADTTSEQEPLRLGKLLQYDAEHARASRYGTSAIAMILGATTIASSGVLVAWANGTQSDGTPNLDSNTSGLFTVFGVVGMIFGGVQVFGGLISLFIDSPTERAFDEYAPVAIDKNLSAAERVRRGEIMLGARAESERRLRVTNAATSFVSAAILAGFGLVVGLDKDLITTDDGTRAILALGFGVGAVASLTSGVASLVWERGTAEIAWEHWKALHEHITVQTAQVHFAPILAPTHGGAMGGFSLRF